VEGLSEGEERDFWGEVSSTVTGGGGYER